MIRVSGERSLVIDHVICRWYDTKSCILYYFNRNGEGWVSYVLKETESSRNTLVQDTQYWELTVEEVERMVVPRII